MTPPCEANPAMAAMKKSDESKFKAICTGVRSDGAYIETGENDNLIVQKLEGNAGTLGVFGYSYLEENADKLKGIAINGVAPGRTIGNRLIVLLTIHQPTSLSEHAHFYRVIRTPLLLLDGKPHVRFP